MTGFRIYMTGGEVVRQGEAQSKVYLSDHLQVHLCSKCAECGACALDIEKLLQTLEIVYLVRSNSGCGGPLNDGPLFMYCIQKQIMHCSMCCSATPGTHAAYPAAPDSHVLCICWRIVPSNSLTHPGTNFKGCVICECTLSLYGMIILYIIV
jgi:hypothetical protein